MASRMNYGGSIDLNRMKIDPRTGEKFGFNLDIVAATAWYGQEASRELSHGRARNSVLTWIYILSGHFHSYFATDFDEHSMASTMNSGGSIDLNRIKIDPRTGEKFSFILDKVAATAWYGQEASRF